ncbi:MAG: peptidoglycan bridge formation glycyltransferase FemA/FemB family protein, partial [Moheibacter sp.]
RIKFVLQPIFCQQLGVFYKEEIPDELFKAFEKKLHKYRVRAYSFNEENTERYSPKGESKVNYVLDLNRPYEEIFQNYSQSRRKDIKKAERLGVTVVKAKNTNSYLSLFKNHYAYLIKTVSIPFLKKFSDVLQDKNKLIHYDVLNNKFEIIASQFFLDSRNRKICIGFTRNKEKENHNSSAFIKNYLIKKLVNMNFQLDFEGSINPNIARFMEGFSPEKKHYTNYSNFTFKWVKI